MTTSSALVVDAGLSIPRAELAFRASRAGGPGGQHVNTSSTRIELLWNLDRSRVLDDRQRARLREKLGSRVGDDGTVRVVASAFRSQARNREDAESRLAGMVRRALAVPKARKKTRPGRHVAEQRLQQKRRHSLRKQHRRGPLADD